MLSQENILNIASEKNKITTREIAEKFSVSRQYANVLISKLVADGKLIKIGSTRKAFYITPEYASEHSEVFTTRLHKSFITGSLEEHKILDEINNKFPLICRTKENIRSIFTYAVSEMLNNAIEHSGSKKNRR
jgi:predicted transcriptional regulator of viral defense system